ncbi:uncharacterized protein LOC126735671 [Anthonomus grandis grandis]|uniref:uncharacterized protein LOC126735671 n=1 Tax=Anthonomus grandis grandis TaxID=2921223 RepID=UPI002165C460|nr:uncharacterized protein LOC126735671 [Anthonomus grandis grandis]
MPSTLEDTPENSAFPQVKTFTSVTSSSSLVFLSTAKVAVLDSRGIFQTVRVLLDSGSQASFITDKCLMRLGLPRRRSPIPIYGLGETSTSSSGVACCTIGPIGKFSVTFDVEVKVVPKICSHLPEQYISLETFSYLTTLKLADDKFNQTGASAKDANGISLNDALLVGPKLQQNIFSLLLNFRFHEIVFTCDIKQMYRQILVKEEHRSYQKILWRFSQKDPIQEFILNTVTYGVSSSPFLALRTIVQIAKDQKASFPIASQVLQSDSFVDDLATGAHSIQSALRLQSDLIQLLGRAGLKLRKWASNHQAILQAVPLSDCQQQPLSFDNSDCVIKILGLTWLPTLDKFSYTCIPKNNLPTKRGILSELARIFDPLGFIAPISFFAKYLIQYLWVLGMDWDQPVPKDVENRWVQFQNELSLLQAIKIPRRIISNNFESLELHGICDGSEKEYAAVVYCRVVRSNEEPIVSLVCAKSKISPLKRIWVPRLELCGAGLLANLLSEVIKCYSSKVAFDKVYGWCDSKTVIAWIKSSPHRWKNFVSNRVTQIQSKVSQNIWHYVSTKENPADCASRGLLPNELLNHPLWWAGPSWLQSGVVPCSEIDVSDCHEESRPLVLISTRSSSEILDLLTKFSNFGKIKRIIAYCLRFIFNCKNPKNKRNYGLDLEEIHKAVLVLVRETQIEYFFEDILNLKNKKLVSNQLRKLAPFLDESDILRVGGRLKHANVAYNYKHPMLLPRQARLTELIILETHVENFHPGFQTTHSLIVQNFWILNPKRAIRSVIGKFLRCFRVHPRSNMPQMADLPTFRVNQLKCFSHVCVDMGGPFQITPNRTRGCKILKAYLCLFVCCCTKALHLEVTTDLSSESFLAALRRMISRRGKVANIYSDCGTNFVASSKYLKDIMQSAFETEKISWHFNPPAAPHFNGLAESGIKSVKSHLVRVIGDQILTYEEFNTVVVQIEAMLNSRPLSPISSDPNDLNAVTPSHFLLLEPITALPDFDLTNCKLNTLTRWQLLVRMCQDFWKRWRNEYLHTLSQRYKWNASSNPPKIDMLVLIKNEQLPPSKWEFARVVKLHQGSDGICRVVTVKTARGLYQRPVVKICPLPGQ